MTHTDVGRLAAGSYVSLTTFRRDGTPVATPVWVTRDGDRLFVITAQDSGKVKRLRRTPRVTVAPCDARGRVTGAAAEGTARLLDAAGTAEVTARVRAKYGLTYLLLTALQRLRRRAGDNRVGLEITLG